MQAVDCIPISVTTLLPTEAVALDLYQRVRAGDRLVLYRAADYPLSFEDLERLRGRGVQCLYITKDSRSIYQRYLRRIAAGEDSRPLPLAARAGALSEVVRDVLKVAFSGGCLDQAVEAAEQLGSLAADILTKDTFAAGDLLRVLYHDYATFTHSANVAFYCGMLATSLGFEHDDVKRVTIGGLLHDFGKLDLNEGILCKIGRLDESEYRRIRLHPVLGFRKLAQRDDLVEGQLMMTYQHHERLDGKGYPVGNVASGIHPWAKLCAVVDVFEALTSQRPYRKPMSRGKALMLQQRDSGKAFDPEMLACWKNIIQTSYKS